MANDTDRARKYASFAATSERRAASTRDAGLKRVFLQIADEYRNLALQIEDPVKWRAMQKDRARGYDCWGTRKGPATL
jgi:hypothetical protein